MSRIKRKEMINKDRTDLSLSRQCQILKISRSSLYYTPVEFSSETLELMRQIDRIFTQYPFFGSRADCGLFAEKGLVRRPPSRP